MTATTSTPTRDQTISRNVRVLMSLNGLDQAQVATTLGITPGAISKKLRGVSSWKAAELPDLASLFDRPLEFFFRPTEDNVKNS